MNSLVEYTDVASSRWLLLAAGQYTFDNPDNSDTIDIVTDSDFIGNLCINNYCVFSYTYRYMFPFCHVVLVSCLWITQQKMTD